MKMYKLLVFITVSFIVLIGCDGSTAEDSATSQVLTTDSDNTNSVGNNTGVNPANPVSPPVCGAYWGVYVNPEIRAGGYSAENRTVAIDILENDIGRLFAIDHQFYRWDDFLSERNVDLYLQPSIAAGRIPFLSWKPVMRDGSLFSWASIVNGEHDVLIKEKANSIKNLNEPVMLVFDHEANARVGDFSPGVTVDGHVSDDAGTAQDFIDAWRHIHHLFEQEQVVDVSWVWIMTRTPFFEDGSQADSLYPGDDYVDWVGLDPYNFFHNQERWTEMETLMQDFTRWIESRGIGKPWIIGEWGSVEDPNQPGRKGDWLKNAGDYFESETRLKAIVHFDSAPDFNWLYDSSDSSREAFIELSNRPYFKQGCG